MGDAVTASEPKDLYVEATDGVELFVPGRLCLFGEHSDWAGSYARHAFAQLSCLARLMQVRGCVIACSRHAWNG